jgi:medium-chain acyl-[acyl-carrier-protein] hydrolase
LLLTSRKSVWLRVVKNDPFAALRLFCFPYAGAGANAYRGWAGAPFRGVEIAAVQLPGRETRHAEPPFTSLAPLVAALVRELSPYLDDKPFAFFGHSMGALVSFELARELRRAGHRAPQALFLSGRRAPDSFGLARDVVLHRLGDAELIEELSDMNGTDAGVMAHEELRALLLPLFRADFAVCETYRYGAGAPLDVPIHALGGSLDPSVGRAHLEGWARQSNREFSVDMFDGDHFYVNAGRRELLGAVSAYLSNYVNAVRSCRAGDGSLSLAAVGKGITR